MPKLGHLVLIGDYMLWLKYTEKQGCGWAGSSLHVERHREGCWESCHQQPSMAIGPKRTNMRARLATGVSGVAVRVKPALIGLKAFLTGGNSHQVW